MVNTLSQRSHHPNLSSNRGFTLVEMLVVMAIIVIITSIGVNGLNRLGDNQKTGNALSLVEAMVDEARTRAIATGEHTRVLIYGPATSANKPERELRYLAIADGVDADKDTSTPRVWTVNIRGQLLPRGVYYNHTASTSTFTSAGLGSVANAGTQNSITMPGTDSSQYHYIEFNSEGICIDPNATASTPGAVIVVQKCPGRTVGSATLTNTPKDADGLIIWRNGSTSRVKPGQL